MVSDPVARQRLMVLYEQRLAADPASRAFLPLAELYRGEGRPEDARLLLEAGLARHPAFVSAQVVLAQVLLDLGDETQAQDVLARVIDRDPENVVALRLLAASAENGEDWTAAVRHLERIVRCEPGDFEAVARLQASRKRISGSGLSVVPAPAPAAGATVGAIGDTVGGVVTLTLVDLYLRQGHRDRARELLVQMAAAEPDREDVKERLLRLAEAGSPAGASVGGTAHRRTSGERQGERRQFDAWLESAGED
jgi:tetratricopeptide (TPR) repeat protein